MSFYISRFKDIEKREFEVEVVTPLFLGGSDTKKAELRAASLKGVLRFWWRAIYGINDIENMKKREADIFGSPENKSDLKLSLKSHGNCQGVLADLPQGLKIPTQSRGRTFPISIVEYLAFGLCEYKREQRRNVYTKEHIPAGAKFSVVLKFNKVFEDDVINSFKALVSYGGLGSHSRNGFGSLASGGTFTLIPKGELKDFTALSSKAVLFDRFSDKNTWEDALSEIGKAYREARTPLENKHSFKRRPLIAKPIIVKGEVSINDRHAKPYFLHVNKQSNGTFKGQILFLPYNYADANKRNDYLKACEDMNKIIKEQMPGGAR